MISQWKGVGSWEVKTNALNFLGVLHASLNPTSQLSVRVDKSYLRP